MSIIVVERLRPRLIREHNPSCMNLILDDSRKLTSEGFKERLTEFGVHGLNSIEVARSTVMLTKCLKVEYDHVDGDTELVILNEELIPLKLRIHESRLIDIEGLSFTDDQRPDSLVPDSE